MADTQANRLDRIEEKIDKLSEAMISLARAEEKLIQIEKNNHASYERMNRFSEKMDRLEEAVVENAHTVRIISRLFWVVIAAAAGSIASQIWM